MDSSAVHGIYRPLIILVVLWSLGYLLSGQVLAEDDSVYHNWSLNTNISIEDEGPFLDTFEYSHDNNELALFSDKLILYDTALMESTLIWKPPFQPMPTTVTWSTDDRLLAWDHHFNIKVFDVEAVEILADLSCDGYINNLEFNMNGSFLAASTQADVYIFETEHWELVEKISRTDRRIFEATWHPNGLSILLMTDFGLYQFESVTWEYLGDFNNDKVGTGGAWTEDNRLIYPAYSRMIVEFDVANDSSRVIVNDAFGDVLDFVHLVYDRESMDVIIHDIDLDPMVYDRSTGNRIQDLGSSFTSLDAIIRLDISSDGRELAISWKDTGGDRHLSLFGKVPIGAPEPASNNPSLAFAMLTSYAMEFGVPPEIDQDRIVSIRFALSGSDVVWIKQNATFYTNNEMVVCQEVVYENTPSGTGLVRFILWFNWTFDGVGAHTITLEIAMEGGIKYVWDGIGEIEVVTALQLNGGLIATGDVQGLLEDGGWTMSGEGVTWTFPRVSYLGYPGVAPPSKHINFIFLLDSTVQWSGSPSYNATTIESHVMPSVDSGIFDLTLITSMVHNSSEFSRLSMTLRVDGVGPDFLRFLPEQHVWQASTNNPMATWMDDGEGSGVAMGSIEFSARTGGAGTWSEWASVPAEVLYNGTLFSVYYPELLEGTDNWIRWRASDNVGNSNETPQIQIYVDLHHVTFDRFSPQDWTNEINPSCSVVVTDIGGSGVKGDSIEVRWSVNGIFSYGDWVPLMMSGSDMSIDADFIVSLNDGTDNLVQWRAEDVAGTGITESVHYIVRIDIKPPVFTEMTPTEPQTTLTFLVSASIKDEGGSEFDPEAVEWSLDGVEWSPVDTVSSGRVTMDLTVSNDGMVEITLRASDHAGNVGVSDPFPLTVDTTPPFFRISDPPSGQYLIGTECTINITTTDNTTGIDVSRIQYSLKIEDDTHSEWSDGVTYIVVEGGVRISVSVNLSMSHKNWIRFRVWDLVGNGPSTSPSIHLPVDLAPKALISSPEPSNVYTSGESIRFDSRGSSDPEGGGLSYIWRIDGGLIENLNASFSFALKEGDHRIELFVYDEAGQNASDVMDLTVLPVENEPTITSWLTITILCIFIFGIIGSSILFLRYYRTRD